MFNQGRGLLNANCWGNADNTVYGIDARDIWVFDGSNFKGLGNQRVKNWFFDQLDPLYVDRVFMEINTQKNQMEIYYPTTTATGGVPNRMISYRYDLDIWNPPRVVYDATFSTESPVWIGNTNTYINIVPTNISSSGSGCEFNVTQYGTQYTVSPVGGVQGSGYNIGDTLKILGTQVGGATPANDITITVDQIGPSGAPTGVDFTTARGNAWGTNVANYGSRCVAYVQGKTGGNVIMKDQGFSWADGSAIESHFHRDNIKMIKDYSGKLFVHRILPEVVNLDSHGIESNPGTGNLTVAIEGRNSVGGNSTVISSDNIAVNTEYPWIQFDQNAFRVTNVDISNSSNVNIWMCNGITWQYTQVEDDR